MPSQPLLSRALRAALALCLVLGSARAQIELPDRPRPPAAPADRPPPPPADTPIETGPTQGPEQPKEQEKPKEAGIAPKPSAVPRSIDLPDKPRGDLAERLLGRSPYEEPKPGVEAPVEDPALLLPAAGRAPGEAREPQESQEPVAPPAVLPTGTAALDYAAAVFAELRRVKSPTDHLVEEGVTRLSALDESGRMAARAALDEKHAPVILAASKVLLRSPLAEDRARVRYRMRGRLPNEACAVMVDAFVALDPVGASPSALCELLDHEQQPMRAAAMRQLELALPRLDAASLLPPLETALASKRTDTRLRALNLLGQIDDPAVERVYLDVLSDRSAQIAMQAVLRLAASESPSLDDVLIERAFASPWVLRDGAYALLTLIEREDSGLRPILDERHIEPLLSGTTTTDPFVAGACAAALAGIGYRNTTLAEIPWLDRDVPHLLVRGVSGVEFHNDFSALVPGATRRLALISGQSLGSNGPDWLAWWRTAAPDFKARRATLLGSPEDSVSLQVSCISTVDQGVAHAFRLVGPAVEAQSPQPDGAEVLRISAEEARDYFDLITREGVLGPERMPSLRGSSAGRELALTLRGRTKSFFFAAGRGAAWFDKLFATADVMRENNRWQHYRNPLRFATAEEHWRAESPWWSAAHDELERGQRLKTMVLEVLPLRELGQREAGLQELARLYRHPELVEPADLDALIALLRDERFHGPRSEALLELMVVHLAPGPGGEPPPAERVTKITEAVLAGFGTVPGAPGDPGAYVQAALKRVLGAGGRTAARAAAGDRRPAVRVAAAELLARDPEPEDERILLGLLADPAQEVELEAVHVLGTNKVEAARSELLVRARLGAPRMRSAALEACGALGGNGVRDVLVQGLADPDPVIKQGAARGLAHLKDPSTAPLLVSLLARGPESDVFEPAREGLFGLGSTAWPELVRAMNTPGHRSRREIALLLARQGVPDCAPVMMAVLTDDPKDTLVAQELAVLSCVEFRGVGNPAKSWFDWWESVVHDDSLAWLCAALERQTERAPAPDDLRGKGTRSGVLALFDLIDDPAQVAKVPHVAERARRELARLLGREISLPTAEQRELWRTELRKAIDAGWDDE